ncbi:alpha/beta hydrolase [Pacificimonas flava]|uniref:Xylanase n=1 Tax=Pacificimonas flava TaxID=1234595 RepID=M2TB52_9SPHN|nr:alpha/beta hydrolase [Pacificimonas flava]EMD83829.1 Xylanase [Pacificimonas flava]MBB5280489.1 acetyl esterase/lipase [Pacificimonas flava]
MIEIPFSRRALMGAGAAAAMLPTLAGRASAATPGYEEEIPLWEGPPPGEGSVSGPEKVGGPGKGYGAVSNISQPRMRVYRPKVPNGRAVLVMGGGGYFRIQLWKESTPIALWLQARGYTVFDLIYRLPNDGWAPAASFMDAQRAMRLIRARALDYTIRPDAVGVLGFSAGGHLAGMTALAPAIVQYDARDAADSQPVQPDFSALLFPVVTLAAPYDTTRTRRELIGENPGPEAVRRWSLDTHASKEAPPTFIAAAADDTIAPPAHGIMLFNALTGVGAAAELHLFERGGHGFGLGKPGELIAAWPGLLGNWLDNRTRS